MPFTLGSSTTLSPLISWIRRKKSFRSTSLRLTEIGSPVYFGPVTARRSAHLGLLFRRQIHRRLHGGRLAACDLRLHGGAGRGQQVAVRLVHKLGRGFERALGGLDHGWRRCSGVVLRLVGRLDEDKVLGGGDAAGLTASGAGAAAGAAADRGLHGRGTAAVRAWRLAATSCGAAVSAWPSWPSCAAACNFTMTLPSLPGTSS